MQIDPKRLHDLRRKKRLSRPQLAERSGITARTIQRWENEPEKSQKTREDTLNRLAKALGVEPGVLTGELPLPKFDKAPNPKPVQIGAQVAPKVRLAYDLIKRRYGVSATEVINMAPLFFALLAEGSLAWRREKLKELKEGIDRLKQIGGFWSEDDFYPPFAVTVSDEDIAAEENSIDKVNLFGEHLLGCVTYDLDPSTDNPFASYLRKLKGELDITGVDVDSDDLMFGAPLKFPDYDLCRDELDSIANGSASAKVALETGYARLSEIPDELMAEDAGEKRAKWLEDKLSGTLKDLGKEIKDLEKKRKEIDDRIAEIRDNLSKGIHIDEGLEVVELLEEQDRLDDRRKEMSKRREELVRSLQKTNSNTEKGGDDQ